MKILSTIANITRGPKNLRPCLYGPTGAGKTARVHALAETLGLPVRTLLLAHMLPEELSGIPHVTAKRTAWPAPEWAVEASKKPHLVFLDELDKARPDTLGAALTLLWELRVGDVALHPDTVLVVAQQPVNPSSFLATETGKAISARLIWLPVQYDWNHVTNQLGLPEGTLDFLPDPDMHNPPILPVPSPRQVEQVVSLYRQLPDPTDEAAVRALFYGVLPKPLADGLIDRLNETVSLLPEDIADAIMRGDADPADLEVSEILASMKQLAQHCHADEYGNVMWELWLRASDEDLRTAFQLQYEALEDQRAATDKDEAIFLGESTEEEVENMIANLAVALARKFEGLEERKPLYWTQPGWADSPEALEGL